MKVDAVTQRFASTGQSWSDLGTSPNCGLECYLGEAQCRVSPPAPLSTPSLRRLASECITLDSYSVWRWERTPTIKGVIFPPDWDDTSKALDYLLRAQSISPESIAALGLKLPSVDFWQRHLTRSIFEAEYLGVDRTVPTMHRRALSVFFGPQAETIPRRDDPMVTVATVRSTGLWFPSIANQSRDMLTELLLRPALVVNLCLERGFKCYHLSRYYFSLGHLTFRLMETLEIYNLSPEDVGLNLDAVLRRIHSEEEGEVIGERGWWNLLGVYLGVIPIEAGIQGTCLAQFSPEMEIVFRHRRLNHFYGTLNWTARLQRWEIFRLSANLESMTPKAVAVDL